MQYLIEFWIKYSRVLAVTFVLFICFEELDKP